jgi:uncharacterized membrane protein YfcA
MYTQADIDEAVAAGAFSPEAAASLRTHLEHRGQLPAVDEEQFRLITGFNDIFVSIAAVILLFAVAWIGQSIGGAIDFRINRGPSPLAGLLVAGTAWGLAEFFTARRRMALPSILLLLAFAGGVLFAAGTALALALAMGPDNLESQTRGATVAAVAAAVAAGATWFHWRRFRVPITVAVGAAAVAGLALSLILAALGDGDHQNTVLAIVLALGVGVFLFAMRWDSSDPARVTRRSDVAFWLHLLAAPMIVHPVFALLGLTDGRANLGEAAVVVLLYVALAVVALAIDRRALLVSALAYVLFAINQLFREFGAVDMNVALTALVIGSALLLLSAFWHQARTAIVRHLPGGIRAHLPVMGTRRTAEAQPA